MRPVLIATTVLLFAAPAAPAQDKGKGGIKQEDVDKAVERGCEWLRKNQQSDGSWNGGGGSYPTVMTAMAGLALLMEGSTPKEGKYSDELSKAVQWFLTRSQNNGLLGNPQNPTEGSRYIYGHGFGMLFLACVYGEEEDPARRRKLEAVLNKAVEFSCKAATRHGGWGYVSGKDGGDFDEGSTTITQLQGLRACRNAGIVVPKGTIDKAVKYLRDCTTSRGGLVYNYSGPNPPAGGECQAITAAACACAFSSGNYDDKYAKMWIKYCKEVIYLKGRVNGHDEYQNYYFSQVIYVLGDDRYLKLFPDDRKENAILWSEYKKAMFAHFLQTQGADGGWQAGGGWGVGPVFATGTALMILQLEKNIIPFYHR
jgi:hypothetical protein